MGDKTLTALLDQPHTKRKTRVALMGEFSAGKSTLLNMLLDDEPFPVKVTATRLPPVWTSQGEDSAVVVVHDGTERPIGIDAISSVSLDEAKLIRLKKTNDILDLCDLIDMPGVSDPNMPASVWLPLLEEIDIVIWCTHATQAWRQSEAAIWERARAAMTGQSILLVTQMDKLKTESDRNRVMSRVTKETHGLFNTVFPISTLQALQAGDDPDLLEQSGAPAFLEHFVELLFEPLTPATKQRVDWGTMPELPATHGASARVVNFVPAQPAVSARAEDPAALAEVTPLHAESEASAVVVPRRVPRPSRLRTRPVRLDPKYDGLL